MKVFTINSFALTDRGGNPAGVVPNAPALDDHEYLSIAKKVGFSETAFILPSKAADFKIRFFTPKNEVDLCGHATIASCFLLFHQHQIGIDKYTMETKAGNLSITVDHNGKVWMSQLLPKSFGEVPKEAIAQSLNVTVDQLSHTLPIQIYSTGLKDIIVPVKNLSILNALQPDFDHISQISEQQDAVGYHLFAIDEKGDIYCRNFAPRLGINEEAATGTASGALAGYLFYNNHWQQLKNITASFYQGFSMMRESKIDVKIQSENGSIKQLHVGGNCKNSIEIEVKI